MMSPATGDEVRGVLGDLDTFTIERILDTHATVDDLAEAVANLEDERRFGDHREPTSACVAEVRRILEDISEDEDENEYAS